MQSSHVAPGYNALLSRSAILIPPFLFSEHMISHLPFLVKFFMSYLLPQFCLRHFYSAYNIQQTFIMCCICCPRDFAIVATSAQNVNPVSTHHLSGLPIFRITMYHQKTLNETSPVHNCSGFYVFTDSIHLFLPQLESSTQYLHILRFNNVKGLVVFFPYTSIATVIRPHF